METLQYPYARLSPGVTFSRASKETERAVMQSVTTKIALGVLLAAALAVPVFAIDVWDQATEDDNTTGTDNGLTHGSEQLHDLGAEAAVADQDWFIFSNAARSSYEVLIDGTSGDMNLTGGDVARMSDSVTVVQNSVQLSGYSAALRWQNATGTPETNWIRVSGASCSTTCSNNDQYRIRMYETTYSIPRFNNSASQITVVLVTSVVTFSCSAQFNFFDATGTFLGSTSNTFSPRETFVLNSSTLGFAAGASGSISVSHTCGYSGLTGKAVALEPSTGFTFDTAMIPRGR
jgi:hypothetical protein